MLLIHAEDDKVISPASARVPAPVPPDIIYVESKYGGHLGFGTTDLGWVNQVAQKYLLHISSREKPATAVDQALQERLFSSEERVVIPRSRM
jgi:predicted alpha/beta-fold hydrolase